MSDDYEELRQALLDGPRAGPWCLSEYTDDRDLIVCDAEGFDVGRISYQQRNGTARYIAAANPETVSRLLAEVDRLRAEDERLRDELADWQNAMLRKFDAGAAGSTDLYTWITCLSAKNERLRQDAERLDYIEGLDHIERYYEHGPDMSGNHVWFPTPHHLRFRGLTFRAAIDAARAAGGEK